MKDLDQIYQVYKTVSTAGFAAMALFLILAIALFIIFDIPTIIGNLSGKNAAKRVAEIKAESQNVSANRIKNREYHPTTTNLNKSYESTTVLGEEEDEEATMLLGEEEGTMVLGEEEGTMVLGEEEGTMVLGEEEGTMVLGEEEGTMVLGEEEGTMLLEEEEEPQPPAFYIETSVLITHTEEVI